jgi:hypothetical protein
MPDDPNYEAARRQLDFFLRESNRSQAEYLYDRTSLRDMETHWWTLSQTIYNSAEFDDPVLRPLIQAELAASQNWRGALSLYANAKASGNDRLIDLAREQIERADRLTDRVSLYVY